MATPNIILINCDDLGYGDLSCYGSRVNRTPALDRMAEEGIRFTDFYMAAPVCSPSRGAMMTGCYPCRIGFGSFDDRWVLFPGQGVGLNPNEKTVAALLKDQGYATSIVGKWHCGDQPEFLPANHGFDSYYGIPFSNDMGRQLMPDGTIRDFPPLPLLQDGDVLQEQPDQAALTERYVEQCVRFLREHRDEPFFLYFAHMYVHLPIYAPEKYLRNSRNGRYGAGVECVDWSVAAILDELKRLGLDDNTLVVFTSDNGSRARNEGGSNAPLRGAKGTTWEGGMRVPCIMRWPGRIPAGQVSAEVTTAMDFLPTFCRLAGAEVPGDRIIDGKDITPIMFGETEASSPYDALFYYLMNDLRAVRCGKWKLHVYTDPETQRVLDDQYELYDLENDIGEQTNLAGEEPDIVSQLAGRLQECREDLGDASTGVAGQNCRPVGKVDSPRPLTEYDETHPYIDALYDVTDRG